MARLTQSLTLLLLCGVFCMGCTSRPNSSATAVDASVGDDVTEPTDGDTSDSVTGDGLPSDAAEPDTAMTTDTLFIYDTSPVGQQNPPVCAGGDRAWLRRVMPLLLGRRPRGYWEMETLAQFVAAAGRPAMVDALLMQPAMTAHWSRQLLTMTRVHLPRMPLEAMPCWATRNLPKISPAIAKAMANGGAETTQLSGAPTLLDVADAAIMYGDLTPLFRAAVFPVFAMPTAYCGNPTIEQTERVRRRQLGRQFLSRALHRGLDCVPCHNSSYAVNDAVDPAKDLHWPVPGKFETSLFGFPGGRPEADVAAMFRFRGVVSKSYIFSKLEKSSYPEDSAKAARPFGLSPACGAFIPQAKITPDPLGSTAWLAGPVTGTASVWRLDDRLRTSFNSLKKVKNLQNTKALSTVVPSAMGWTFAAQFVDSLWTIAHGRPLTMDHGFSRNVHQRNRLTTLTQVFVGGGFALQPLLRAVALDPWFDMSAPATGCGKVPYAAAPLLNPLATLAASQVERGNTAGDGYHRLPGWSLVHAAQDSLNLKVTLSPMIATEEPYLDIEIAAAIGGNPESLEARSSPENVRVWRLAASIMIGGLTKAPKLFVPNKPTGDWLTQLVQTATQQDATLEDTLMAARDRFWGDATFTAAERMALTKFFGVTTLKTPVKSVLKLDGQLRMWALMLLTSPRFTHAGLPSPSSISAPAVAVGGASLQSLCTYWRPLIWTPALAAKLGKTARCTAAGVVVK